MTRIDSRPLADLLKVNSTASPFFRLRKPSMCAETSTGASAGPLHPPVVDRKPNPTRTLNHLQTPAPRRSHLRTAGLTHNPWQSAEPAAPGPCLGGCWPQRSPEANKLKSPILEYLYHYNHLGSHYKMVAKSLNLHVTLHSPMHLVGEGHGSPLQCSCLENPRDGGAWWAAVCGVAQSRTRLEQHLVAQYCLKSSQEAQV